MPNVEIPFNFSPRPYQIPLMAAMNCAGWTPEQLRIYQDRKDAERKEAELKPFTYRVINRASIVWHRRAGKDKTCLNFMVKKMQERVGNYYYLFPTYKQGKKILWEGFDKSGFKMMDHIPKTYRERVDNSEMSITMKNGSMFRIIGTDDIDSVVGVNPVGCVFSEYSLQDPNAWNFISPILAENGGWAIFNCTPRGKNHAYHLLKQAQDDDRWFTQILTADITGAISKEQLEQEKKEMYGRTRSDALFNQEYMCSFETPVVGAYYGTEMVEVMEDKRVTEVPYEPTLEVHTAWDLGMDDQTSIIFFQQSGGAFRIIDVYSNSGEGLRHYVKVLKEVKKYNYGKHYFPHDIKVRELGTGKSRFEVLRNFGIVPVIIPKLGLEDGIEAVRNTLPKCYFDRIKSDRLIESLKQYHKEWDDVNKIYKSKPDHDWSSHLCDAMRMLSLGATIQIKTIMNRNKKKNKQIQQDVNPLVGF